MSNNYCQILVTLVGKLLSFNIVDNTYNKYKTGTGELLISIGNQQQVITLSAGQEQITQLEQLIGHTIEITGAIRNYRQNNKKFNVVRVYSAISVEDTYNYKNQVHAECELVGLMVKSASKETKVIQLYFITHEKYDKHTRLNAIIFSDSKETQNKIDTLSIGQRYEIKGYIQLNKTDCTAKKISNTEVLQGDIEVVVSDIKQMEE